MKEMDIETEGDTPEDECYNIAASMIDEIQVIRSKADKLPGEGKFKGAFKRKLVSRIKLAKQMAITSRA